MKGRKQIKIFLEKKYFYNTEKRISQENKKPREQDYKFNIKFKNALNLLYNNKVKW